MVKYIIIFFLSLSVQAQTLYTTTYSNWIDKDSTNVVYWHILDTIWQAQQNSGANPYNDLIRSNNIDMVGDGGIGAYRTENPLYVGGKALDFDGTDDRLQHSNIDIAARTVVHWIKNDDVINAASGATQATTTGGANNGLIFGAITGGLTNEFVSSNDSINGQYSAWAHATDSLNNVWHCIIFAFDDIATGYDIWIDGVQRDNVETGDGHGLYKADTFYELGTRQETHSSNTFNGLILVMKNYSTVLTSKQIIDETFLYPGWVSLSSGALRERSGDTFNFAQGVVTDTVYYNTLIASGVWSIQVDIKGNSSGETYRILTSSDKLTWTTMGSGSAPANSTTTRIRGNGSGYIGLAVSSAADTVFFDNLTVTGSSNEPGFSRFKKWTRFKAFK